MDSVRKKIYEDAVRMRSMLSSEDQQTWDARLEFEFERGVTSQEAKNGASIGASLGTGIFFLAATVLLVWNWMPRPASYAEAVTEAIAVEREKFEAEIQHGLPTTARWHRMEGFHDGEVRAVLLDSTTCYRRGASAAIVCTLPE